MSALSSKPSSPARSSPDPQHLRRFLAFIVEQALTGQGHTLKESVIAHELYGKGTDFDGGTDPVVRVDARRLRDKLREYLRGPIGPRRHLAAEGRLRALLRREFRDTLPPSGWSPGQQEQRRVTNLTRAKLSVGALALVVAVATAVLAWRALVAPADAPAQLLPLASYPGPEGPPALSPDGKLVAFAWSGTPPRPDGYLCEGRGE